MWIFDSFDFLCLKNKIITDIYKSLIFNLIFSGYPSGPFKRATYLG